MVGWTTNPGGGGVWGGMMIPISDSLTHTHTLSCRLYKDMLLESNDECATSLRKINYLLVDGDGHRWP